MFHGITGIGRRFSAWRRERRSSGELGLLDDNVLKDIGIHRSSIDYAARSAVRRRDR
jgi:uncharacterized protein YjiS (DUF1127 family)